MNMAVAVKRDYPSLLQEYQPRLIQNDEEYERALSVVSELMDKEKRTDAEGELLRLFINLIKQFEQATYPMEKSTPKEVLTYLMDKRNLKQADLVDVIGSKGVLSEIVNGKRGISKNLAKKLGDFFHVSHALFL